LAITTLRRKRRFQKEYDDLPPPLKDEVDAALMDLRRNPIPPTRRFHSLGGHKNPKIYTIDATSNKAYKISLELDGECAILRRIATHKEIDRMP
jgi:hypothetical protein